MRPPIYREMIIPRYAELWKPIHAAGKKVDLTAHVGHRVEITGVPSGASKSKSSMGGEGSGSQAGTSGSSGQSGSMSGSSSQGEWAGKKIRVESLRHIADSCSGQ